ncbi:hypothetical protein A2574_03880 [Candidatus Shapirobacteria bacterium RIFOXYD1_FULL_38_32]|uniref:Uncharacterized protein n=2 Tax=Candidatus Shapironibacteriota TaxID=1752721 RepID=A0A0G0JZA5_9BACT|nr:MAG: hypothetical protein US90_C0023G0005 [Candidatus Shapirobacteria bacterium GW2011_GWE2_38_30]KKQ89400.1 MAG: hypothetical protein UT14_C0059G0005 [Candidatus Shapirobacteria bacterium GW2011_GWE1_38_92]OGL56126.1 MAG: hypothetical protein A2195_01985 [Candidatus Shapirobacteria bacterium RIFOXYA1_FULL_39_17]OGL57488.1 MAG: hypothetical protein A2410_00645 [Candidatus Shapirobacteria bacterium RIFOXYC1_FULL_38_24]OGL57926.1 MAG: hypothetical protein A2574_03880 [Candidatus Shapirobacteri
MANLIIDRQQTEDNFRHLVVGSRYSGVPAECPNPRLIQIETISFVSPNPDIIAICPGVRSKPTCPDRLYDMPPICEHRCVFRGNTYYRQIFQQTRSGEIAHIR